jgi:hypothetical protein
MKYNDENRGEIQNRDQATRVNDFRNLKFKGEDGKGDITPTDLDAFIDFGNKHFIFLETKFKKSKMSGGQRVALERLCDATTKAGINSLLIIASHDGIGDIDVGNCEVTAYRHDFRWVHVFSGILVKEAVICFRNRYEGS